MSQLTPADIGRRFTLPVTHFTVLQIDEANNLALIQVHGQSGHDTKHWWRTSFINDFAVPKDNSGQTLSTIEANDNGKTIITITIERK